MNMIANNCVSDELICLVCNLNLKDLSCINIFCTSLSHNEELLASFVLGILHPSALELNSNYICLQCYNLFQMLEQARWTAKNIESEIFKIYQSSRDKRKLNKDKIIINTIKNENDLVNKNVNLQEKLNIPTNFDQLNQMQTFESLNDECNIREKNHPIIIEDIHSTNLQIIKVPSIDISSNNTNLILIDKNECILPSINTDSLNELSNYNQEKSNMPKKHKEKIAIDNSVSLKINTNDFSNKEDCLELNNISTEALKNTIPNNEVCEIFNDNNGVLSNINQNNIQNKESSKINKKKEKINIQSSKTVKKSKCDSKQSNYPCPTCEKTWRTSSELKSHVKTHSSMRPYMCEKCGQAYKHKHALEIHIGMHNGINPFQCDFCNKCFTQKGALMRHLPIHTGEMPYQCEICGKRFVHHTSYNMHTLSHTGKKTHQCPNCDLSLLSTSHLKRHMRVHTGEKPYSCPSCGKRFAERYNLCAHQKIHGTTQIINKSTKKIQYKCERCLVSFNTQENFQDHIQQHRTQIEMESNVEWIKPQEESTSINQIINNNWNNFSYTKQLQTSHHQLFND